jgi:hypothetical protein
MNIDRQSGSRLPDDPAYWENLAERSVQAAFGADAAHDASPAAAAHAARVPFRHSAPQQLGHYATEWWRGMSDAAFVLAAGAVLALIGGSLLLDDRAPGAPTETHALTGAFAPDDPLLGSLLNAAAGPPPAAALLKLLALREAER